MTEKVFMQLYLTVLDLAGKVAEVKREAKEVEKLLKWTMRIVNKYLFKHVHPHKAQDLYHSADWIDSYAYDIWDRSVFILSKYNSGSSNSFLMANVMKAVFYLLDFKAIYDTKVIRESETNVERLIQVLFNCLILSPHEFKYFEEHPADFIKNNDSEVQQEVSLFRYYTIRVLATVTEESHFQAPLLRLCNHELNQASKANSQDIRSVFAKEMVYSALQVASFWLVKPSLSDSLKDLLELYLLEDLYQTQFAFLRIRLLTLLTSLADKGLSEVFAVPIFTRINAYLNHESSTVRLAAILLVEQLLAYKSVRCLIRPEDGQQLVDLTLNTMLESENECLAASFHKMLGQLEGILTGSYLRILANLAEAFAKFTDHMKSLDVDVADSKEIEERGSVCRTVQNCMTMMDDIVLHNITPSEYRDAEKLIFPVLYRSLTSMHEDLMAEGSFL